MRVLSVIVGLLIFGTVAPAQDAEPAPATPSRPKVKLLEPGAEPRQALRYEPRIGQSERAVIEMRISSSVSMGGAEMPAQEMPPTKMTILQTPAAVNEAGDYVINIVIEDFTATGEGPMVAMMRQSMQPLVGATAAGEVSPRGESLRFEMQEIDAAGPMRAQMESMGSQASQLGAVFPEEPVGVGARWEVTMELDNAGVMMQQTMLATLKSIEGDVITLDMAMSQSAEQQDFAPPGMPPGMEVDLESLTGSGEGVMQIDLSRLVPVRSTLDATTKIVMAVMMQGQQQEMAQSMKMAMSITGALASEEPAPEPEAEPAEAGGGG
ncbi:MAG: DUF6263 family protein [Phycisphaerales bacterium JB039]